MSNGNLEGYIGLFDSKTVRANIVSILATVGTVVSVIHGGGDPSVVAPAVATAAITIWGNLMSILGRKNATQKIG